MNKSIEAWARGQIKTCLSFCTPEQHRLFKLMYAPKKDREHDINDVVDAMPSSTLDWALTQVENTLKINSAKVKADGGGE